MIDDIGYYDIVIHYYEEIIGGDIWFSCDPDARWRGARA
jgi:hypothetical protein